MASFLKELSLAIGLMSSDQSAVVKGEGWQGYVWRVRDVNHCIARDADDFCTLIRDRWDWKRDQRYSLSIRPDKPKNRLSVRLVLDNRDKTDDDNVCVAAVFYDRRGREIAISFENWHSMPQDVMTGTDVLKPARKVGEIARVAIGSKQCTPEAGDDVALFRGLRARIGQK